ncbi:MAG: hypothetical protein KatS3mg104_1571 [Phycisphaerae bacterium]|nr:MAG: hypothetical protein KatS3mg104_1571 [Phycisphaerae bacterium]
MPPGLTDSPRTEQTDIVLIMPIRKPDYRARHRALSHEAAHAQGDSHSPETIIPQDLPAPRGKPELIQSDAALIDLLTELRQTGSFAYDSEFIGESSYHPRLCLIQVATTTRIALIDPLSGIDLTPFWKLLADPSVEKIVHAGAQDIEPVARLFGQPARNVLDTQIMAGFCAMAYPTSLAKLIAELTGVSLEKGSTLTFWEQRPLSNKQIRYAADDVRYLPAAAMELKKRLEITGHTDWARIECDLLCDPSNYGFNPETAFEKVRGVGGLEPRELNVLRELVLWRDAMAREVDSPARSFLRDEVLIDLSRAMPRKREQLNKIRNLPRPVIDQHAQTLLVLIERGASASTDGVQVLRGIEPTPTERFQADALWTTAQAICIGQSIDPALVTSSKEISLLYRHLLDGTDPSDLRIMKSWRKQALADKLIRVYRDRETINFRWPG